MDHALETLRDVVPEHVLEALRIIMKNNIFQFSERFYKQIFGTAMGCPPATMWATTYFAPHEEKLKSLFAIWILASYRYIDDGFNAWNLTGTPECNQALDSFKNQMQTFVKLRWDFEEPSNTVTLFLRSKCLTPPESCPATLRERFTTFAKSNRILSAAKP
jgi:hypothetical protein